MGARGAAEQVAAAGSAQVEAAHALAFWLGLAVGAIPVLIALGLYLPGRSRFVREATAAARLLDSGGDTSTGHHLDLLALRAMARQPLHRLARVSADPLAAWRSGDPDVIRELAALELGENGLSVPVVAVSADKPVP